MSVLNEETSETANNLAVANEQTESERLRQVFIEAAGFDPFEPSEGVAQDKVIGQKTDATPTKEDPLKAFRSVITESPVGNIAAGMIDAVKSTLNIPTDIFNLFTDIDKNGIGDMIPDIDKSDSATLGVVRSAAQFMTDFVPAFRALKGVKAIDKIAKKAPKVAGAIRGEVAGAIAGAAAFDPDDPNLFNLFNQLAPKLRNPVFDFIATDPNDEAAFNRLRNLIQDFGLGAMTEGFLGLIRGIRSAKGLTRLKDELKGDIEKKVKAATKKGEIEAIEEVGEQQTIPVTKGRLSGDIAELDFSKINNEKDFAKAIEEAQSKGRERIKLKKKDRPETKIERERFEQKRGIRSIETSKQAADFLDITADELARTEKGTAFNAEQIIKAVNLLNETLDNTQVFAQKIADGTGTSIDKVEFLKGTQLISMLDPVFFGVRGESGRALQSFTVAQATLKRLEDIAAGLATRQGGEVTIERFAGMYLQLMKETSPKEVAKWLRITRRLPAMIKELFLSSLLSGPKTHIVNVMGNASTLFMAPLERAVAARLPMSTVVKGESTYMMFGMVRAWSDSIRLAGRTLKTGIAADAGLKTSTKLEGFSTRQITAEAFELANDSLAGRAVNGFGAVVSFPLRALLASDVFFKTMNRGAEISALAIRDATEQNLTGKEAGKFISEFISDPDIKFVKKAEDFAAYQTFTQDLGAFGNAVQNLANAHLWAKFFLPFVRTPINIFKYSYERTPIGGIHASLKQAIKGSDPVARDLALARLAMGSAASAVFATMTASGMITGSGPPNKEMRKIMKANGWQPNSFFVRGSYYSYSRLDPVGQMIGDIADFVEGSQYLEYTTTEDIGIKNVNLPFAGHTNLDAVAMGIVIAYSKNLLSKTYVTGMQNALDLLEVGITTGELGQSFDQAVKGARQFTLSFIPTIAKDIRKSMDPILREANSYGKAWRANSPFHSNTGFPERNIFGQVIVRGHMTAINNLEGTNKILNPLMTFINPLYITHDKNDIVMEELIRRDAIIGQMPDWIAGSKPTYSFEQSKVGEGIKLTDPQQDFWKIEAGKGAREDILRLMNSSDYRFKMSDFDKQDELKLILTNHRTDAKDLMIARFGLRPLVDKKGVELDAARQVISELQID